MLFLHENNMVLKEKSKIIQSVKSYTQYVTIPSAVVRDSQYPFKKNDRVEIEVDPMKKVIIIKKR
jgi:hypothetical protein